jgi:formylglycine-generating enzyme required for sulfatase activity
VVGDNKRKVNLPGGYMALTPTTVRQWNWYCADTGKTPKATTVALKGFNYGLLDHPVTEVSYWEACDFAKWAGVGLPSEEQWEHAARGNDGRKFPWGNDAPTDELCHSSVNVQKDRTDTVFNRPKGASPYGCLDMSGNVWEWTSTVHK